LILGVGIASAIEMQKMMAQYPQNWTIFDFNAIYSALDVFEVYVSSDEKCLAFRAGQRDGDTQLHVPHAGKQGLAGRGLQSEHTLLGGCPEGCGHEQPPGLHRIRYLLQLGLRQIHPHHMRLMSHSAAEGFSTYGCSSITKMCTCSIPTTQTTPCSSNMECSYALSTCQLITGLDDMSYGNQPCTDCTKDVQCLMRAGSGLGKCGCMFQAQALQKCTQMPGQFVPMTDSNKLCGYLPNTDRSSPLTAVQWESLAMVKCIYLKPAHIYCTQAYRDGAAIPLAVGLTMASLTPSFSPGGSLVDGRCCLRGPLRCTARRVSTLCQIQMRVTTSSQTTGMGPLSPAAPWPTSTNRPHRIRAEVQLGPLDTLQLHSCAYWRLVGRRAIEQYNLTSSKGGMAFSSQWMISLQPWLSGGCWCS
jgi:hypothetical protein